MNKALRQVTVEQLRKVKTTTPHKPFTLTVDCCSVTPACGALDIEQALYRLFRVLVDHRGIAEARRVFLEYGREPSKRKLATFKNYGLLDLHDLMKPEPNVQRLARELAEENKTLPRGERRGPTGTTDPMTMLRHLRRLLADREKALKNGKWRGPVPESWFEPIPKPLFDRS